MPINFKRTKVFRTSSYFTYFCFSILKPRGKSVVTVVIMTFSPAPGKPQKFSHSPRSKKILAPFTETEVFSEELPKGTSKSIELAEISEFQSMLRRNTKSSNQKASGGKFGEHGSSLQPKTTQSLPNSLTGLNFSHHQQTTLTPLKVSHPGTSPFRSGNATNPVTLPKVQNKAHMNQVRSSLFLAIFELACGSINQCFLIGWLFMNMAMKLTWK